MNLQSLVNENREGRAMGLPCFCSSNEYVIHAALGFARDHDVPLIIEATCNQVNPFGGYTGQTPDQFAKKIRALSEEYRIDPNQLNLGGDHLGPEPWKDQPAEKAMANAKLMVQQYVEAGFTKIHLDASMACADEGVLATETIAQRAAELCLVAERHAPNPENLSYIIGTEVPVPGGEADGMDHVVPTNANDLAHTIAAHQDVFKGLGLENAFERVLGVVVQPGVDFGTDDVMVYAGQNADALSKKLLENEGLCFEAHSTDYQPTDALASLVNDHFAFLKVGPELTFCFREAVFALAEIERQIQPEKPSMIVEVLQETMMAKPEYWKKYYKGNEASQAYQRVFSFSDRIRYYWDQEGVKKALSQLTRNLSMPLPAPLVSQFGGKQIGEFETCNGETLIKERIEASIARYYRACGF